MINIICLQIITVVTDKWYVFCYDDNLNSLWSVHLRNTSEVTQPQYYLKSMAIMVLPVSIKKTDMGMIVVGGSFGHVAHKEEKHEGNET